MNCEEKKFKLKTLCQIASNFIYFGYEMNLKFNLHFRLVRPSVAETSSVKKLTLILFAKGRDNV